MSIDNRLYYVGQKLQVVSRECDQQVLAQCDFLPLIFCSHVEPTRLEMLNKLTPAQIVHLLKTMTTNSLLIKELNSDSLATLKKYLKEYEDEITNQSNSSGDDSKPNTGSGINLSDIKTPSDILDHIQQIIQSVPTRIENAILQECPKLPSGYCYIDSTIRRSILKNLTKVDVLHVLTVILKVMSGVPGWSTTKTENHIATMQKLIDGSKPTVPTSNIATIANANANKIIIPSSTLNLIEYVIKFAPFSVEEKIYQECPKIPSNFNHTTAVEKCRVLDNLSADDVLQTLIIMARLVATTFSQDTRASIDKNITILQGLISDHAPNDSTQMCLQDAKKQVLKDLTGLFRAPINIYQVTIMAACMDVPVGDQFHMLHSIAHKVASATEYQINSLKCVLNA